MNFSIDWLSFFVLEQIDDEGTKQVRMSKILSHDEYEQSELKTFLDGEFTKIAKRKVEKNPLHDAAATKLGQFILEPGHPLDSNPNYGLFKRLLHSTAKEEIKSHSLDLLQSYVKTPQVRGGVLIIVKAKLDKLDDQFLFLLKCDFEQKTAVITDENSLISNVEMAINAKNIKSIMYPFMEEEGMVDIYHVKIHQFSHARYFEEFLKFIEYPRTITEIVSQEVISLAKQHIEYTYPEDSPQRQQEEEEIELIATSPKRELAEKWEHETVMEAMHIITEHQPEIELKFKLDHLQVRAMLSDYGTQMHIAKVNGRYVVLLEGDVLQFEKGFSPVEFLKPKSLHELVDDIERRAKEANSHPGYQENNAERTSTMEVASALAPSDDTPPW
ncbi:DUF3900 domain-containing protein [Brevibacillus laterosporus]|uniref:DUF3900 domain-containing protein n=1 Tax=Brevibacillus laterosporus TaxID=1465 RepID=UPI000B9A62A8|nr:DUF3900 domain-containing protein [Brevibacillus laterosporus]MCG7317414.1 DUF3900 domain-containing protein [Brevibacillus laterosporus]